MSRLAPVLRLRRRQLDGLRLEIATEQRRQAELVAAAAELERHRQAERSFVSIQAVPADAWFAASRRRLVALAQAGKASEDRLALLRGAAVDARARLSLLEAADSAVRAAAERDRNLRAQAALDDRTAALWARR